MVTTNDREVAGRLRKLRQHAMGVSDLARHSADKVVVETYDEVGYNYRMTDLQAALGLVQLSRLPKMLERRRQLSARYSNCLSKLHWLILPTEPEGYRHNFQSYMVRLRGSAPVSRNELMQWLLDRGIASRRAIMAIHREVPYRDEKWKALLPITEQVTDTGLILPLFFEMTTEDQDYVIECLYEILNRPTRLHF
jgi:dTDP-4-amino-4,6-dideoxygalactose transaminase